MQDPRTEIIDVVKRFTTTDSPDTQLYTLSTYFTPDAAFDHPLAKVKSGSTSRADIIALYQWYKIASPKIDLEVESVAFDEVTGTMFLTVIQVFHVFFSPFRPAPARLVVKLNLVKCEDGLYRIRQQTDYYQPEDLTNLSIPLLTPIVRYTKLSVGVLGKWSTQAFQSWFGWWMPVAKQKRAE